MCINVLGKHQSYYIDLQIEQKESSIGCDPVEPDEHKCFLLESPEIFFCCQRRNPVPESILIIGRRALSFAETKP